MNSKTFTNEYGEEFTVTVDGKKILVFSSDISDRRFNFLPVVYFDGEKMLQLKHPADIKKIENGIGTVVLRNGNILSADECRKIYDAAVELGYEA